MERGTTIILVATDSAWIRQYKFTSLKKCKLNFTYRAKFPWEKRVQISHESLMVILIALKQIKLWNGKRYSHGSGICRFSINQRREMHSLRNLRQILDICTCLNEEKKLKTAVQVWPCGRCWGLPHFLGPILSSRWWNWPSSEIINKYINKQVKKIYFNINKTLTLNTHQLNTLNTHQLNHQIWKFSCKLHLLDFVWIMQ